MRSWTSGSFFFNCRRLSFFLLPLTSHNLATMARPLLVGFLALPFLQLTQAIAFSAPLPTSTEHGQPPEGSRPAIPDPTRGPSAKRAALRRRDASSYEYTTNAYISGDASLCGWENGDLDSTCRISNDPSMLKATFSISNSDRRWYLLQRRLKLRLPLLQHRIRWHGRLLLQRKLPLRNNLLRLRPDIRHALSV